MRLTLSALRLAAAVTVAYPASALGPPPIPAEVFRELLAARLAAFDRGDAAAYGRLLASDFVHVDEAGIRSVGAPVLERVAAHAAAGTGHVVGEVHVRRLGDLAIVDADVTEYLAHGPRESTPSPAATSGGLPGSAGK